MFWRCKSRRRFYFLLFLHLYKVTSAWENCPGSSDGRGGGGGGGGVCPTQNTCCRLNGNDNDNQVGCIPSDMGAYNATCCADHGETGCPVGYTCSIDNTCQAAENNDDPLVQIMPRYTLCHVPSSNNNQDRRAVHWFPVHPQQDTNVTTTTTTTTRTEFRMPYYSSHGRITSLLLPNNNTNTNNNNNNNNNNKQQQQNKKNEQLSPQRAIVVIHGAGRNADDYYCTMLSTVRGKNRLVVAPHFLALSKVDDNYEDDDDDDNDITVLHASSSSSSSSSPVVLRWNETDVLGGDNPWRYGANAYYYNNNYYNNYYNNNNKSKTTTTVTATNISSFDVIDQMVQYLLNLGIEHVTVVGHSAGGQFVQRWALLSPLPHSRHRIRAVVANPSSYAYLTNQRYDEKRGEWSVPTSSTSTSTTTSTTSSISTTATATHCPLYNSWEWGLDLSLLSPSTPPYVRNVLTNYNSSNNNNNSLILQRFLSRDVVYLAGGQDRCNVSQYERNDWCYSHGLETTCMDQLQGSHRLARHKHYVASLVMLLSAQQQQQQPQKAQSIMHMHTAVVVQGVGHDHSLMFHSVAGRQAILGITSTTTTTPLGQARDKSFPSGRLRKRFSRTVRIDVD